MPMKPFVPAFAAGVVGCLSAWPQSQPAKQLSARELFYAAPVQTVAAKKAPERKAKPAGAGGDHRQSGAA